jgi:hypothetical protein
VERNRLSFRGSVIFRAVTGAVAAPAYSGRTSPKSVRQLEILRDHIGLPLHNFRHQPIAGIGPEVEGILRCRIRNVAHPEIPASERQNYALAAVQRLFLFTGRPVSSLDSTETWDGT